MDIMMQWEMFLAGIAIMFFLGCFFTKNMRETHFEEILSKGAAIFFIAIFVFNYHLNLPVKEVYCWILLFAALGLPLCIYKIYNNGKKIDYCKKSIIVPFIVLGGVLVLGQTVLFKTLSPWLDSYTYINCADYMLEHGWKEKIYYQDYHPWITQIQWYQDWGLRIGGQQLMSFLTAVMGKELSFDSLIPCTAIGTILNTCALLRLTKIICNRCIEDNDNNFIAEIAICLFAAFNGFLFIDPFRGFYPMTLGSAFYVHALAEILNVFWTKKFKKSNIIWGTAYICCLAITYSELIPFLTLHILCLMGYACYKERKIWNSIIQYIFSLAIFSIVFLNVYVGDVIKAVLMEMQDRVGSERKFGFLEYLGYIFGTLPSDYSFHRVENPFCKLVYLCLTLIVSVWIIFLIKKYMKKDCRVELGYLYLPFIVLLFYFNFFAPNLWEVGTGNSYSVYKSMRYFILVLLPVIAMLINQFYYQNGIRKKIVKIYLLVIILIGSKNISYHYNALRIGNAELLGNFEDNFGEYYELRERYKFEGKIINLVDLPEAHSRLVSYFLKECRLAWPYKNDIFHHRYVEKEPKYDKEGITLLYDPDNPEAIAGLREIASDYCKISLDDGFYAEEILIDGAYEGNSFCWSESQSCVTVSRPIDYDACVKICFDVIPHNPYQKAQLHIYDKDSRRKIKDIDIEPMLDESGEVKAVPIELNLEMEGALERELQIEYDGLVYDGERELAYLILLDDNIEYRSTEY